MFHMPLEVVQYCVEEVATEHNLNIVEREWSRGMLWIHFRDGIGWRHRGLFLIYERDHGTSLTYIHPECLHKEAKRKRVLRAIRECLQGMEEEDE
jgi:hypothetical protein